MIVTTCAIADALRHDGQRWAIVRHAMWRQKAWAQSGIRWVPDLCRQQTFSGGGAAGGVRSGAGARTARGFAPPEARPTGGRCVPRPSWGAARLC